MKKKFLAAAIGAMLVAGSASAVQKSKDGVGDLLIAPAYFIGGGFSTDIKVVNTSATKSVVAKVVFRHPVTSAEVLDFLIYLTPSDVWKATVSCLEANSAGVCTKSQVFSADDSMQKEGTTAFGSSSDAATITSTNGGGEINGRHALPNQGYFEVMMATALDIKNSSGVFGPGVSKDSLYKAYCGDDSCLTAGTALIGINTPIPVTDTPNVLMGTVAVTLTDSKTKEKVASATLPMVALEDYDNPKKLVVGVLTGLDDQASARTSNADLEEALWANNFAVPYEVLSGSSSVATFTFPTKLTYSCMDATFTKYNCATGNGKLLGQQYPWSEKVVIKADVYDNMENTIAGKIFNVSPLPKQATLDVSEFDIVSFVPNGAAAAAGATSISTGSFGEGWARIYFANPAVATAQVGKPAQSYNVGRAGVPAIVTYMIYNGSNKGFSWAYASSTR